MQSTFQSILFVLFAASGITVVHGCSYMCMPGSNSFGSSLVRAPAVVRAYIWKDVTPGPIDPTFPWGTKYFQGRITQVFKGGDEVSMGRVIFAGGQCGTGYEEKSVVLLFGEIRQQMIKGYAAPMPVFVPTSCTPSPQWKSLGKPKIQRLKNYDSSKNPCVPDDCADASPVFMSVTKCPDGSTAKGTTTCGVVDGQCGWITAKPKCP